MKLQWILLFYRNSKTENGTKRRKHRPMYQISTRRLHLKFTYNLENKKLKKFRILRIIITRKPEKAKKKVLKVVVMMKTKKDLKFRDSNMIMEIMVRKIWCLNLSHILNWWKQLGKIIREMNILEKCSITAKELLSKTTG